MTDTKIFEYTMNMHFMIDVSFLLIFLIGFLLLMFIAIKRIK